MGFNDSAVGRYFKMDERKHITMYTSAKLRAARGVCMSSGAARGRVE